MGHAAGAGPNSQKADVNAARIPDQATTVTLTTTWKSDGKRHWLAPEVRDTTGALYLLGNPVYINY
jgi:hypothetical protein